MTLVSSRAAVKSFISAGTLSEQTLFWQSMIHALFLVSAIAIALIDRIMSVGYSPKTAKAHDKSADPDH